MSKFQSNKFDILETKGDAYDRGFTYGSKRKRMITDLVQSHYTFYSRYFSTSKDQLREMARKFLPYIEGYSPEISKELEGTAAGAGIGNDEIAIVVAFVEIYYPMLVGGCTAFAVAPPKTKTNEIYSGQNNDEGLDPWMDGRGCVLVKFKRKDGPDVLSYMYAGTPAMMGLNTSGLSLCLNAITCEQSKLGVPSTVVAREILQQKNLDDAIDAVDRATRANSFNYLIAEKTGRACDVEAIPSGTDKFFIENGMLTHTNHILSKKLNFKKDMILTSGAGYGLDTIPRYCKMNELIESNSGNITLEVLFDFLRDHTNYPNSICRHADPKDPPELKGRSLDGFVMAPGKGEMWIAHGNPCENEFIKYLL